MDSPRAASTALNKKLEQLSQENAESTIYRVHSELRNVNTKAYEPKVIAIGPYHRDKDHLKMMEDHKLRNLQSLIKLGRCNVEACAEAVGKMESRADQPSISRLSSSESVEMLLLDGCFIVELVRKHRYRSLREEYDTIFRMNWMLASLRRDLMLFENQIPFFVLSELFDLIKYPSHQKSTLPYLLSNFFSDLYPGENRVISDPKVKHLLDFIHRSWRPPQKSVDCWNWKTILVQANWSELGNINATHLREANVQFKKNKAATATLFDIEFKDGVLLMPPLSIQDDTESLLRNLVVYEQYFERRPHNFVTDYIVFLDFLINSPKDVELLTRNEILKNFMGDEEVVAKMVNKLGHSVIFSPKGFYAGIAKDLNDHCRKPWNRWMANLRRNYLNSPWAIISIIAAIVLLLLTATQTVFSILQMDSTAQEASIALTKRVEQLSHENAECTIYRVYRELRSVNPKAYEPEVIAIGPYHRDKPHLKMMEDHKLRNLQSLIKRGRCNVEACAATVGKLESEARKCYADQRIGLNSSEFVEMLLLDGCFIVELVRKHHYGFSSKEKDSVVRMRWMYVSLPRDLMLFENQIPFFVLSKLFDLIKYPYQDSTLLHLLFIYFRDLYPGGTQMIQEPEVGPDDEKEIKHLLDFIHRSWVTPKSSEAINIYGLLEYVNCASGLREANVQFKKNEAATATLFDIEFKDGVMLMPRLSIQDTTECVLRNLIAYEQYFEHSPHNFVTDYVRFLDSLINSPKDMELLLKYEILENLLGDEEVVAKIVNRLSDSVINSNNSFYAELSKNLKQHCRKPWNRRMAELRRNYLHSPWAVISILAALLLCFCSQLRKQCSLYCSCR